MINTTEESWDRNGSQVCCLSKMKLLKKRNGERCSAKCVIRTLCIVMIFCILILIKLVYGLYNAIVYADYSHPSRHHAAGAIYHPKLNSKADMASRFEMLDRSIYVYRNVCVESSPVPIRMGYILPHRTAYFNVTKRITVYNHWSFTNRTLTVAGSSNSVFNKWDIRLVRENIPKQYTYLDRTAFFVVQTCPGNLHHFWEDEFNYLFSVAYLMERLSPKLTNQLLYKLPWDLAPEDLDCFDIKRYEYLLESLHVAPVHDAFYRLPVNTCFKQAIFGLSNLLPNNTRMSVNHVLAHANLYPDQCQAKYLTIIQRTSRRILNINDLKSAAIKMGYNNTSVVYLENYSVQEQLKIAACSTVFVGVQGAGLQWSIFMPENATLIEISWPDKYWPGYFRQFVIKYNIRHEEIVPKFVRLNWATYQEKVRFGKIVTQKERDYLKLVPPKNSLDNIWKWADVFVNASDLENILSGL